MYGLLILYYLFTESANHKYGIDSLIISSS